MATPRNISPILDGFTLGQLLTQSDTATFYIVTQNHTHQRYLLKIISLPASTQQLDRLLMSGAFAGPAEINAYYKEQVKDILRNVQVLRHMATVGGFLDYDCVQVVASEDGKGYEVYLLCPLRQVLPYQLQREDLTHADVVNLALDLCASLTVCRRSGYCYTNLKPGNVFRHGSHYHIGDLGFLPLYEIGRIPLPEHYRSSYSPPELMDGTRPINDTCDVYALGLILYQAYNGGILPGNDAVFGRLLLPPKYADYEMAEIILRACAPDPSIRWQGPEQMGLALMRYAQRNGMRNEPIIPPILQTLSQDNEIEPFLPEEDLSTEADVDTWDQPTRLPVRRRQPKPSRKWKLPTLKLPKPKARQPHQRRSKLSIAWIAIGILGVVLVLELVLMLWLFR